MSDLVPSERAAACEHGCNGCDDCTDYEDEDRDPPEFGCCLPLGECCMPGLHFPSECHTAADYERAHPLTVGE